MSDQAVEELRWSEGAAWFTVANRGQLEVSDVGVAGVVHDCYSRHRYLWLPWLEVIADPEGRILEETTLRGNNCARLDVGIP